MEKNEQAKTDEGPQALKVGEKEYTPEKIAELEGQAGKAAEVMAAIQQYGMEPADFIGKANQAFDVIGTLIEQGMVDEEGRIVRPETKTTQQVAPSSRNDDGPKLDFSKSPELRAIVGQMQKMATVIKGLSGIETRLKHVETDNARVIRDRLSRDLKAKHEFFTDDDVDKVFNLALRDQSKDLWKHAEAVAEAKGGFLEAEKRKWAQEHGLDYEALSQNRLKQQDAKGGAGALFKGKRMSFLKKDKDAVDPKHATKHFFDVVGR